MEAACASTTTALPSSHTHQDRQQLLWSKKGGKRGTGEGWEDPGSTAHLGGEIQQAAGRAGAGLQSAGRASLARSLPRCKRDERIAGAPDRGRVAPGRAVLDKHGKRGERPSQALGSKRALRRAAQQQPPGRKAYHLITDAAPRRAAPRRAGGAGGG